MSRKLLLTVFGAYLCVAVLHVYLNVGLNKLSFLFGEEREAKSISSVRVGFLPVT